MQWLKVLLQLQCWSSRSSMVGPSKISGALGYRSSRNHFYWFWSFVSETCQEALRVRSMVVDDIKQVTKQMILDWRRLFPRLNRVIIGGGRAWSSRSNGHDEIKPQWIHSAVGYRMLGNKIMLHSRTFPEIYAEMQHHPPVKKMFSTAKPLHHQSHLQNPLMNKDVLMSTDVNYVRGGFDASASLKAMNGQFAAYVSTPCFGDATTIPPARKD